VTVAYDEKLAERIRRALGRRGGISEKKMFGGLAFLLDGPRRAGALRRGTRETSRAPDGLHGPSDEGLRLRQSGRM